MGELFNQIEPQNGKGRRLTGSRHSGKEQAARDAGVSQDQRKQAQRVANIPKDEFEKRVGSEAGVGYVSKIPILSYSATPLCSAKIRSRTVATNC